jgi:hypothetical protein
MRLLSLTNEPDCLAKLRGQGTARRTRSADDVLALAGNQATYTGTRVARVLYLKCARRVVPCSVSGIPEVVCAFGREECLEEVDSIMHRPNARRHLPQEREPAETSSSSTAATDLTDRPFTTLRPRNRAMLVLVPVASRSKPTQTARALATSASLEQPVLSCFKRRAASARTGFAAALAVLLPPLHPHRIAVQCLTSTSPSQPQPERPTTCSLASGGHVGRAQLAAATTPHPLPHARRLS